MSAPMIAKVAVSGVSKTYQVGRKSTVEALHGIDLSVETGQIVTLLGTSGCGKSTLLNIIGGLEDATTGIVTIDGDRVVGPGPDRGMVFQQYSLFPWKSVFDNVAFGLELAKVPSAERTERVNELLSVVGLAEHAERVPRELSGGMRQRVAIARALAPNPDVLLLDEPFGALDALTKQAMHELLRSVWRRTNTTIVMVTHDVSEAVYLSHRTFVMTPGPGRIREAIDLPFGPSGGPATKRTPQFLDLVDELEDLLRSDVIETVAT